MRTDLRRRGLIFWLVEEAEDTEWHEIKIRRRRSQVKSLRCSRIRARRSVFFLTRHPCSPSLRCAFVDDKIDFGRSDWRTQSTRDRSYRNEYIESMTVFYSFTMFNFLFKLSTAEQPPSRVRRCGTQRWRRLGSSKVGRRL